MDHCAADAPGTARFEAVELVSRNCAFTLCLFLRFPRAKQLDLFVRQRDLYSCVSLVSIAKQHSLSQSPIGFAKIFEGVRRLQVEVPVTIGVEIDASQIVPIVGPSRI